MLPIIKWTGSKRFQASSIVDKFPKEINTYYECFIGGGSVLGELMERMLSTESIKVNKIVCIDINEDLIGIWKLVRDNPEKLIDGYESLYNMYNSSPEHEYKKKVYAELKNKYNDLRRNNEDLENRSIIFNWLLRNCFNGLVRYSRNGDFNTSCHFSRNGIRPDKFKDIVYEWSYDLNKFNVEFIAGSYKDVIDIKNINVNDVMYLDPPYANDSGMYDFDSFNNTEFFDFLRKLNCTYLLSYDGKSGKVNNTFDVPNDLYDSHEYIDSSQSSFKRLVKQEYVEVYDSLYIKNKKS